MPPTVDVGRPVRAFPIANGDLADLQFKVRRSEQQIEVPERVEVPERSAVLRDAPIIARPQSLGTAEGIGDTLVQDPTEDQPEQLVPRKVGQTHRALLHRVDEPAAVDELSFLFDQGRPELRKLLRGDRHVSIEDDQHVPRGHLEPLANGIALPDPVLTVELQIEIRAFVDHPLDLFCRPIGGVPLYEDRLGVSPQPW